MSCLECAKTRLTDLGIPANRIRTQVSRLTGQTLTYVQGRPLTSIDHQTVAFNPDLFKQEMTNEMVNQGADAYCDSVTYIQGIVSDTVYPSIWAAVTVTASGQLMVLSPNGQLIMGWDDFLEFILVPILKATLFWAVVGLVVVLAIVIVVVGYLTREPQYTYTDPNGTSTKGSWTQYISNQNTKYWYVCSKDGFGVGERSKYASASDVPADQITLFNDHCNSAPDLSPPSWTSGLLMQIVYASLAIGGIYIAIKLIPPLFTKK